ncbi:MAG: DEAD/DEAH box helicase [Methanomicrobiaceae archaeon]|uniref:RNA helicase n=1 Tax=hydrocarbon metagenome TaxID=938273 RepID=A0A0W8FEB9_9ZZZZ|nr:DEAD/DEAH box helicase [Methanomicrobiaceae archaeon]
MIDPRKFDDLGLSTEMQKAVADMGFEEPTPIQALAIPYISAGRDVTGQAQTGTGKTAAFGIPTIEKIDPALRDVQAIVLCPTRELAIQVAEEFSTLLAYKTGISVLPVYGGQPIERQLKALASGVQIVIGTPGRVMDHLERGTLSLQSVRIAILDEADQMLDMGFREDIEMILDKVPDERQTILFSATMPPPILEISKRFQKNPEFLRIAHRELTVPQVEQHYLEVSERDKLEILSRLIDINNPNLALIFCNTKRKVDDLTGHLQARGYFAEGLHGDMKQSQRDRVMAKFRTGAIDILVATDVAARGIDVEDVDLIVNYDVPQDVEYYVHRIGRTARAGRSGRAITFAGPREVYKLRDIQKFAKTRITRIPVPSLADVEETKTRMFLERAKQAILEGGMEKYIRHVEQVMEEEYTSLEIAAALLKIQIGAGGEAERVQDQHLEDTGAEPGMVRLFINLGRHHQVAPRDIVGAIAGETGVPGRLIGAISIHDNYSFVEVPKEYAEEVLTVMRTKTIRGSPVEISPAQRRQG